MKHQLLISYNYPPLVGPESIQSSRIVSALQKEGWDTTVIASSIIKSKTNDYDLSIPGEVIRAFTIDNEILKGFVYVIDKSYLFCPDTKILWMPFALKKARNILQNSSIDVIQSWSTPFTSHLVGLKLKKEFNKPWVAHFSDPWVDNPYLPQKMSALASKKIAMWEKEVIMNADAIVFTSDETVELVMSKYDRKLLDKVSVLPHTYDPKFGLIKNEISQNNKIVLSHIGNFYGPRNPEDIFNAAKSLKDKYPEESRKIIFKLIGRVPRKYLDIPKTLGIEDMISFTGLVTYKESIKEMQKADVLINIDAPSEKSVFLPSKLIEYIGAKKPVIAITSKQGTTARVLADLGHVIINNNDIETFTEVLKKICVEGTKWIDLKIEETKKYLPETVAKQLNNIFHNIL
ncbi:MAG: glycosyltransferase [Clostridia bacterium]|nr:glycosyltransferase [Clostridia bacterium]